MRDLKFACPHCEQHIKCEETWAGKTIACPACNRNVVVPTLSDDHHLRLITGKVPVPAHAHGAPRAGQANAAGSLPRAAYSKFALASLILSCGSVLIGPFGCIPGIVFGHLAQLELRRQPQLQGASLAKAGLIVGYSFLALFGVLLAGVAFLLLRTHQP